MIILRAGSYNRKAPLTLLLALFSQRGSIVHKGTMVASVLNGQICRIWNIQICRLDLMPLLPEEKQKLPRTTINAFGVHLQKVISNNLGVEDKPSILSSWLGPLATGEVKDGGVEGSFHKHVIAAVS